MEPVGVDRLRAQLHAADVEILALRLDAFQNNMVLRLYLSDNIRDFSKNCVIEAE